MDWIEKNLAKAIGIAACVLLILGLLFLHQCSQARTARTETRLAGGQASAAIASGQDSANMIGNRMSADAVEDSITRENHDAIQHAAGADAPVDPALRDAGLAGLCRRAAYRGNPQCLQHADSR